MHAASFVCRLSLATFGTYVMLANYRDRPESLAPIGLAVSPSQELVVAIFDGGPITVFDLTAGNMATELDIHYHQENWWLDNGQSGVGPRTAFLDDRRLLIVLTEPIDLSSRARSLTLIEWDISRNQQISEKRFEHVINWAICASTQQVAMQFHSPVSPKQSSPETGSLKVWDIQSRHFTKEFTPTRFLGIRLAMANDGSRLVAYYREGIETYDLANDGADPISEPQTNIQAVDANTGTKLVTRYDEQPNSFSNAVTPNFALVTRSKTFALENSADEPKGWSQFFDSGKYVVSSQGRGVRVWAAADGQELGVYACSYQKVISLVGSDSGARVVIGRNGAIVVWDFLAGKITEIWSLKDNSTYFERVGRWLAAVICLAVAIGPGLSRLTFHGPEFWNFLSSVLFRLSLVLFVVSLAAPALKFTQSDGSTTVVPGFQALLVGWLAVLIGQFAWLSNPSFALALIAAIRRAWSAAFVFGVLSAFLSLNTFTLFMRPLPGMDTAGSGGRLSELAIGYFLWFGAMVSFCGFTTIQLRRATRVSRSHLVAKSDVPP